MKILITGASSYVGARIYDYLKDKFEVVGTYNSNKLFDELIQLDITNKEQVNKVISESKPGYVVHVAANPNSRWCDANEEDAHELNEQGTKNIVEASNEINAKVIYISSFAAINPTTLYGKTKLKGEDYTKDTKAGWLILRPSLIIGYSPNTTNDRPFNRILRNLLDKVPAEYETSWKFQPTWLEHICEVIEQSINKEILEEIIPISVPEFKTRFDIAQDILKEFGINVKPIDKAEITVDEEQPQTKLEELGLPAHTYEEMIAGSVKDIKEKVVR